MSTYNIHGGHNKIVPGASSYLNEVTEDRKIAAGVLKLLKAQGHTVYDCTDDVGKTQGANLANIVAKCNKHSAALDISIHFNAAKKDTGDGKTKGVEVFVYSSSSKAKDAATRVCKKLAALGFTNRGVKTSTALYVLKNTKSPAMLVEVCFVDDKDDANLYNKLGVDKICKAIAEGILNKTISSTYSGTSSSTSTSTSDKLKATALKDLTEAKIIEKVGPLFTADQKKTGVLASVSLAQFILESDYGRSELAQNANNCFGMKKSLSGNTWAGSVWDGKSVYNKETKEYVNGKYVTVTAAFRKYPCIEDSIADHSAYLVGAMNGNKKRYAGLKGETSYKKSITIIKNGGYATSPDYIQKICNLIEKYNLTKYDVSTTATTSSSYYKKYTGNSGKIDTVFAAVGVPEKYRGTYAKRKPVATANGINSYKGTASQNLKLISLAKSGKLKKV